MIDVFCEHLSNFGADRADMLYREGTIGAIFAYLGPENDAAERNRTEIGTFRRKTACPIYGWLMTSGDQAADVARIARADQESTPAGWILDIESKLQGQNLQTLIQGTKAIAKGRAVVASCAGTSASHVMFDYRTLDLENVPVDWQCYDDSGEGPNAADGVREMFRASFVVPGWEYRHRLRNTFGWCKVGNPVGGALDPRLIVDSYKQPGAPKLAVKVGPRVWGFMVRGDGFLYEPAMSEVAIGQLGGRVAYKNIRVTLDTSRRANDKHSLPEWTARAASARWPGSAKRKITVYLAETSSDAVLRAIAVGARR